MNSGKGWLAVVAIILIGGLWLMDKYRVGKTPDSVVAIPEREERISIPITALPNAGEAHVKAVRKMIAAGEGGQNYERRDRIVRAAPLLTDEELIAALELVVDPNYAIESLCSDETFPLERQVALLSHFFDIQGREGMDDALLEVGYRFAKIDADATREWLRIFEPGPGSGQALGAVFAHLDTTDPEAAAAMYADLDDREVEAILGYGDGPKLEHLSGLEFVEFVETFRSDNLREFHLRQTVVWRLAKDDPEDALSYVRELPLAERTSSHGRHLVLAWTVAEDRDFDAITKRIVSDLPEGSNSGEAYYVLAQAWYGEAPETALAWINTLDDGPFRDGAVTGYLRDSMRSDPTFGYTLAATISGTTERQFSLAHALRMLVDEDPEAARALIKEANLSESDRKNIERQLERK